MELSPRRLLSIVLSACLLAPATAVESFRKPTVDFTAGNGSFLLAGSSPASIHVDAADWPGVLRAAHDLAIEPLLLPGLVSVLPELLLPMRP